MKRVTLYVLAFALSAVAGFTCLTGCDLLEQTVCDVVSVEDAETGDLFEELFIRGFEDLGGLFGDDGD